MVVGVPVVGTHRAGQPVAHIEVIPIGFDRFRAGDQVAACPAGSVERGVAGLRAFRVVQLQALVTGHAFGIGGDDRVVHLEERAFAVERSFRIALGAGIGAGALVDVRRDAGQVRNAQLGGRREAVVAIPAGVVAFDAAVAAGGVNDYRVLDVAVVALGVVDGVVTDVDGHDVIHVHRAAEHLETVVLGRVGLHVADGGAAADPIQRQRIELIAVDNLVACVFDDHIA